MVKHTQTVPRQIADEWFECVWPFCEIGAKRVNYWFDVFKGPCNLSVLSDSFLENLWKELQRISVDELLCVTWCNDLLINMSLDIIGLVRTQSFSKN